MASDDDGVKGKSTASDGFLCAGSGHMELQVDLVWIEVRRSTVVVRMLRGSVDVGSRRWS